MNRKGMELSINFIVMLILSIVVFSFGLIFIKNVFNEAGNIKAQLDEDSQAQIESLLDRGEMVAIPIASKDVKSGKTVVFGVGVFNIGPKAKFHLAINCSVATSTSGQELPSTACSGNWALISENDFFLEKNEKKAVPIAIQAPGSKLKGTYGFDLIVTADGKTYGTVKQIYINII